MDKYGGIMLSEIHQRQIFICGILKRGDLFYINRIEWWLPGAGGMGEWEDI